MYIAVLKSNAPMDMYGDVPEVYSSDNVEIFYGDWDDGISLCNYLLPLLDSKVDNLLDIGDVDYFPATKCSSLIAILIANEQKLRAQLRPEVVDNLIGFTQKAIELNTGIVIEC